MPRFDVHIERRTLTFHRGWGTVEAASREEAECILLSEAKTFDESWWDHYEDIDHGIRVIDVREEL